MKTFSDEEFVALVNANDTQYKLPEHIGGFYFLVEIVTDEISTGIGTDMTAYLQRWELSTATTMKDKIYFIFKMWGNLPNHMLVNKDISEHEGKEIAVPKATIFSILNNLYKQVPTVFSQANLFKTQVVNKYLDGFNRNETGKCEVCGYDGITKCGVFQIIRTSSFPYEHGTAPNFGNAQGGFDLAFADVNQRVPRGSIYFYKLAETHTMHSFCSLKCAFEYSVQTKSIVNYLDPAADGRIRTITPDILKINNNLGLPEEMKYRGQPSGKI